MYEFIDPLDRTIRIEVDECDAKAYFGQRQIGSVSTTGRIEVDDRYGRTEAAVITDMFVDPQFRRTGIAMEMLKLLSTTLGKLAPARRNEGRGGENALTDEGEALTLAAQKMGYIYPFPEERPDDD